MHEKTIVTTNPPLCASQPPSGAVELPRAGLDAGRDRLRRLARLRSLFAACETTGDVELAMPDALEILRARAARLVVSRDGGPPTVASAWPPAALEIDAGGAPGESALATGAALWLSSPGEIAARSPQLAAAAAHLGAEAWCAVPLGAVPPRPGRTATALELCLAPPPRQDPAEHTFIEVAASLAGDAILRALARVAEAARIEEVDEAARRHAADLELAIDAFPVGALVVEASGTVRTMNRAARDLFGDRDGPARWRLASDSLRRGLVQWPDGRPVAFEETPFARALRGEVVRDVLLTLQPHGDVRRWLQVSAVPLGDDAGAIPKVVVTAVDVTRTREVELDREALLRQVFQDLAPLLRAIAARAERIRDGAEGSSVAAKEILQAARRATSHLGELERAVRLDPRALPASPERMDVKALLLDVLERISARVDVARVSVSAAPGLPHAHVDPDHLERILVSLLCDALAAETTGSPVAVSCTAGDGHVRISVASGGRDVAPPDLPRIFDRFFRVRGSPPGRLYEVRSLAEANRGRVRAEIDAERRLAIHVDLPLRQR